MLFKNKPRLKLMFPLWRRNGCSRDVGCCSLQGDQERIVYIVKSFLIFFLSPSFSFYKYYK